MKTISKPLTVAITYLLFSSSAAEGQAARTKPSATITRVVREVSSERIRASLKKLEAFGTRFVLSPQDHPTRGIGAASRWLVEELTSYSPKLQVRTEAFHVKKGTAAGLVTREVDLVNVVAVLPGTVHRDRYVVIGAHYDSLNLVITKRADADRIRSMVTDLHITEEEAHRVVELFPTSEARGKIEFEATERADAPGVTDDGSGVAAVLELARVMSQYQFDKSVAFVLFSGEEVGLEGAKAFVADARKRGMQIEAMLNNDIIGTDISANGRQANGTVNVFSDANPESPSRALADYVGETVARYGVMRTNLVFRRDRFLRGGDHRPFAEAGIAAVRFTTPTEFYANQHSASDTLDNTSVPYTTMVARANAAVLASLALAPAPPRVNYSYVSGAIKGRRTPMLSRGESGYDAVLRWEQNTEPDVAGYAVVMRSTAAPRWQREVYVGKTGVHRFPNVQIDEFVFGVKAIDTSGNASLVSQYLPQEGDSPVLPAADIKPKQ